MNTPREILRSLNVFPCDPICKDPGCQDCHVLAQIIAWAQKMRESLRNMLSSWWHKEFEKFRVRCELAARTVPDRPEHMPQVGSLVSPGELEAWMMGYVRGAADAAQRIRNLPAVEREA